MTQSQGTKAIATDSVGL